MGEGFSLQQFYDEYPRIEGAFEDDLDESLSPRGPEMLFEIVEGLALPGNARAVDVGCGEAAYTLRLAVDFGFDVTGIDPVQRHINEGNRRLAAAVKTRVELADKVRFRIGTAEAIPLADSEIDLVWCRDVLSHVADLVGAYQEFARVLRSGGRVIVYQMFGTERLEPAEADFLWTTMGVMPSSTEQEPTLAAMANAGLRVDEHIVVGTEWGQWSEENHRRSSRKLLHLSRLRHCPEKYIDRYGRAAYDVMVGDCLWQIYGLIGKLGRHVFVLSKWPG